MCSSVVQIYIICIFCSESLFSLNYQFFNMSKAVPPESLRTQLQEHGFSDEMIEELWKWYDSSEKKGVASY